MSRTENRHVKSLDLPDHVGVSKLPYVLAGVLLPVTCKQERYRVYKTGGTFTYLGEQSYLHVFNFGLGISWSSVTSEGHLHYIGLGNFEADLNNKKAKIPDDHLTWASLDINRPSGAVTHIVISIYRFNSRLAFYNTGSTISSNTYIWALFWEYLL